MKFSPGKSGNPGGRPRAAAEIQHLIQAKGPDLVQRLIDIALADNTEPRTRIEAAKVLLDRGYGRAPLPITADGEAGTARIELSWLPVTDS